jgi:hypothetical protein
MSDYASNYPEKIQNSLLGKFVSVRYVRMAGLFLCVLSPKNWRLSVWSLALCCACWVILSVCSAYRLLFHECPDSCVWWRGGRRQEEPDPFQSKIARTE